MSDTLLERIEIEISGWKVNDSKTWPFNWPGVDNELIELTQKFLDKTFGKEKYKASKANPDRGQWLSLKIERIG